MREQLIDAAMKLFARKGFDATSVDDVVAAVDVSRRTFFRYFDAKEDVLPAWFDTHVASVLATIDDRRADEDTMTSLRHVMNSIAEVYEAKLGSILTIERVIGSEPALVARRYARMEQIADSLAKRLVARKGGGARAEARFRMLARVALAIGNSAIERWVSGGGKGSPVAMLDECWREAEAGFERRGRKRRS